MTTSVPRAERRDQEIPGVVTVGDHDVPRAEAVFELPQEGRFPGLFPFPGTRGPFEHGPAGQRHAGHPPRHRKAQPRLLGAVLGKARLVGLRVGHRHRRAIDQLHLPITPAPRGGLPRAQPVAGFACQTREQRERQASPRFTVGPRVQTARRLSERHPGAQPPRHRVLAAVIGSQHLFDKEHQR